MIKGSFEAGGFIDLTKRTEDVVPATLTKAEYAKPEGPCIGIDRIIERLDNMQVGDTFNARIKCVLRSQSDRSFYSRYTIEITELKVE